jgi:rhamnogalacturonan endolyase
MVDKVYGPVFVYIDQAGDTGSLWEDAKNRPTAEVTKWLYAWIKNPEYPLDRSTVTGRVCLFDGASTSGAWAIPVPQKFDASDRRLRFLGARG